MRLLGAAMPAEDGVADFHRMYLHVTELVGAAAASRSFQDAAFMERLDCIFAGLYLDACRATDQSRSSAWQPLFELRAQPGTASLQYALAGVNAHINFDLGLALVRTCRQLGRTLDSPGVRADFLAVNAILAAAVQDVRESYLAGVALHVDPCSVTGAGRRRRLEHRGRPRRLLAQRHGPVGPSGPQGRVCRVPGLPRIHRRPRHPTAAHAGDLPRAGAGARESALDACRSTISSRCALTGWGRAVCRVPVSARRQRLSHFAASRRP